MRKYARWTFVVFCAAALLVPVLLADVQQQTQIEFPPLGRCVYTCADGTGGAGTVIATGCDDLCTWNCQWNGGCSSFGWAKLRDQ